MSGARGGRRGGRSGGRAGGRGGGGGRGNINMTQAELDNLMQQHVNIALAAFQAAHNSMGGTSILTYPILFLGTVPFLDFHLCVCSRWCCQSPSTPVLLQKVYGLQAPQL